MTSAHAAVDFEQLQATLADQIREVTRLSNEAKAFTEWAQSRDRLVTIWVNAAGVVIKTEIDDDAFDKLDTDELAVTITETTQAAATKVAAKVAEKTAEIQAVTGTSGLSERLRSIPGLEELGRPAAPSMAGPDAESRRRLGLTDREEW